MNNRAKQFMPFVALKGFKEALKEKEKVIVAKKELIDIDSNLNYKIGQLKKGKLVKVVYYNGENYLEIEGMISKIDKTNKVVSIVKTEIKFNDIYDISGKEIFDYDD